MLGFVGIEREYFLTTSSNLIAPRAEDFLQAINDPQWTHELSICQVEDRTKPLRAVKEIKKALETHNEQGGNVAKKLGLRLSTIEVAKEEMPFTIYPDPSYSRMLSQISEEQLRAACRITATHLHFGMPNIETAIRASNLLQEHFDHLCEIGDHSQGERLLLYKIVAKNWRPPYYRDGKHFFEVAQEQQFAEDPYDCLHLVRISAYGTIELRMFGVTKDLDEVCGWVDKTRKFIK